MAGRAIRSSVAFMTLIGVVVGWAQPAPILLEPISDAVVDNGRTDRDDDLEWRFRWMPVAGATAYRLCVVPPAGDRVAIDVVTTAPHHLVFQPGAYLADEERDAWAWAVRARFGATWGPWSTVRAFTVEQVDSDLPLREREPATCPVLRAPAPDATLRDAAAGEATSWRFEWTGCAGADLYTIVAQCVGSAVPLVVHEAAATAFTLVRTGPALGSDDCGWRVRARVDGLWGAWSEVRTFRVAPAAPEPAPEGLCARVPGA